MSHPDNNLSVSFPLAVRQRFGSCTQAFGRGWEHCWRTQHSQVEHRQCGGVLKWEIRPDINIRNWLFSVWLKGLSIQPTIPPVIISIDSFLFVFGFFCICCQFLSGFSWRTCESENTITDPRWCRASIKMAIMSQIESKRKGEAHHELLFINRTFCYVSYTTKGLLRFVQRTNPCFPLNADVFVEAHISEDLAVNQCWDVASDVYLCFFAILCFDEKLDLFAMLGFWNVSLNMQQ